MVAFNKVNAERIAAANALAETVRSNRAKERLTHQQNKEMRRSNLAKERETVRSNLAKETLQSAVNAETARSNLAREAETQRSNLVSEDINRQRNQLTYAASTHATNTQAGNVRYTADKAAATQMYATNMGKTISDNTLEESRERRLDEYRQRNWTLDLEEQKLAQDQEKIALAREQFENTKWFDQQTVSQRNRELNMKMWSTITTGMRDVTQSVKNTTQSISEIPKTAAKVVDGFIPG